VQVAGADVVPAASGSGPAPSRVLPYAAVALAACSWGTWGIVIRHTDTLGPMPTSLESTLVMAVMTLASGLASIFDRVRRPAYKLTIAVSVLTHYLTPIFVALAAPLLLRERMTGRTALAVAASFAGLAIMLVPSSQTAGTTAMWTSAALGAGSAVFYAGNVIVNKFVAADFSTSESMFWHGVVGTPLLAVFVPREAWSAIDPRAAVFLLVTSLGPGALAGLSFVWGLRRIPAAQASTLTLLEPLVSIVLGTALLGEWLGPRSLAGAVLILFGALAVMRRA